MGRIIGIDYGLKRIGIAVSDERHIIARAAGVVLSKPDLRQTLQLLQIELSKYQPIEKVVFGNPLLLNGKESLMSINVKKMTDAFQPLVQVPVILWDERLTTAQVEKFLKEQKVNRKKRSQVVDALAAQLILQNYLDSLSASSIINYT